MEFEKERVIVKGRGGRVWSESCNGVSVQVFDLGFEFCEIFLSADSIFKF